MLDLLIIEWVTNMKLGSNSLEDHPQLSHNRHPVDGALVGAGWLWPCFCCCLQVSPKVGSNFSLRFPEKVGCVKMTSSHHQEKIIRFIDDIESSIFLSFTVVVPEFTLWPPKKSKVYVPTIVPKYPIRFRKKLSCCLEIVPEVLSMCHIFSNDLPSIRERNQEI
jgi:hypothetical protein